MNKLNIKSNIRTNYVLVAALTVFSLASSAHIELGTYTGKRDNGDACSFEVKSVTFKDNVRHPLHERVVIVAEEMTFELSHRPMVDATTATVVAEKEILTGALGAPQAAKGAVLVMGERDEVHGPQVLTVIADDYKRNENDKVLVCKDLVAPEEK
jgi:hypothetical protein